MTVLSIALKPSPAQVASDISILNSCTKEWGILPHHQDGQMALIPNSLVSPRLWPLLYSPCSLGSPSCEHTPVVKQGQKVLPLCHCALISSLPLGCVSASPALVSS